MISRVIRYLTTDIWRVRLRTLSKRKMFLLKPLMIIVLAVRSFDEDKCQLRASALTYYSLLSIVPVVAMAFGIAKGFGFEKVLEKVLLERMPGQEETISQIITFAQTMLETTKGGMIAGIGVAILFWTVIKVLGNIEKSFNDIWGIKKARPMGRKFSDYLSIMLICPVLFILASGVTVLISTQIRLIMEKIPVFIILLPLLKVLPLAVFWAMFSFIYIFMPNTKVYLKSGLLGGIVAGTLYQVVQWGYINFQVGVAKYNAIYGSFAALPLFLVWLQVSWLIVLLGAEIAFARQNLETYEFEPDCLKASYRFKQELALQIMQTLTHTFCKGEPAWSAERLSHELEIPIRLVRQILFMLMESGLVIEVKDDELKGSAFQPARCTQGMTIKDIIDMIERSGVDTAPVAKTPALQKIRQALAGFDRSVQESKENIQLEDI